MILFTPGISNIVSLFLNGFYAISASALKFQFSYQYPYTHLGFCIYSH